MRRFAILAAGCALAAASPAPACSVVPGYRMPSNYELVRKADVIVLARVTSGPAAEQAGDDLWSNPQVVLEPIRALKGELPVEPLRVIGFVSDSGNPYVAHPTPLSAAHPSAYSGSCIRIQYAVGALVVAVFVRSERGLRQEQSPFARSVEDVEGENGTWVRAAASYATIAALPDGAARRAALQAEAARLLALHDDNAAPAIAADMLDAADSEID